VEGWFDGSLQKNRFALRRAAFGLLCNQQAQPSGVGA
jgi:hypothetical protein